MRQHFLPYCLPQIGEEEIAEVVDSLRSGWITTGPKVTRFEKQFADYVGVKHAIAVNSCTAALHLSLVASCIGAGDEVLVPTTTFCATANVVEHVGATPVLVDVDADGLINTERAREAITPRTKAIIPVHFAGQTCDLRTISTMAAAHGLTIIEDAAHAAGASYCGKLAGAHGNLTAFSFYATKNLTTGEGGMITTEDDEIAARMRRLALHGMSKDAWKRYSDSGSWFYEVLEPGFKYNMTDIQASLGLHQLMRLNEFTERRRWLASLYNQEFCQLDEMEVPHELPGRRHVYHLYPIRIRTDMLTINRADFVAQMTNLGIGVSVHFIPLHRHPYYRETYGWLESQFPVAEHLYRGTVSLPLYPRMTDDDVKDVIEAVKFVLSQNRRSRSLGMSFGSTHSEAGAGLGVR